MFGQCRLQARKVAAVGRRLVHKKAKASGEQAEAAVEKAKASGERAEAAIEQAKASGEEAEAAVVEQAKPAVEQAYASDGRNRIV